MRLILFFVLLNILSVNLLAQNDTININSNFWKPSNSFNKKRFYIGSGVAIGTYSIASIGLYHAWYKKNNTSSFHTFDDSGEWEHMDKFGHLFSSYYEALLSYKVAKWTGLSENKSILVGVVSGGIIQSTIEIMDGFSDKWGFSYSDMAYNGLGLIGFGVQQKLWKEQRVSFKVSSQPKSYSKKNIYDIENRNGSSLHKRTNALFGSSLPERYLKDYNAQTYWASVNIASFLPDYTKFPKVINIAFGYGAENMFGGFENKWMESEASYSLDDNLYPRYHQFYIGLDIDFTKIKTDNYFLKSVLSVLNMFKLPGPAVEFNTKGEVIFHLIKI